MPTQKKPKTETEALAVSAYVTARRTADRVLDRFALNPIQSIWEVQTGAFMRSIRKALGGRLSDDLTPVALDQVNYLVLNQMPHLTGRVVTALQGSTRDTIVESVHSIANSLGRVRKVDSVLDDLHVAQAIAQRWTAHHNALRLESSKGIQSGIAQAIHRNLGELRADFSQHKIRDVVAKIESTTEDQWYQVERLVRTETASSWNAAANDCLMTAAQELPQLRSRWTEMINDLTNVPFDKKVAVDSIVMHGQVARPGFAFTMPSDPGVSQYSGKSWVYPPNRPNDRSCLVPWMPDWGIPGWQVIGASRVDI